MNTIKWTCLFLAGFFAVSCGEPSVAATFKSIATKDGHVLVSISGEIAEGDADTLKAAIKAANDAGKFVSGVRLNSVGGSLLEGVKLSETVRYAKMATNVAQGATCASACFLVFAAGETKFANYSAKVGVHGASDQTGTETVQSGAATVSMARFAKELGVPAAIIGRMVVTPPSEMVWLSPSDLQSMGATMIGKPSQIPGASQATNTQQLPAGNPTNIAPNSKASAPPTWNDFVDVVTATSASQNSGRPKYFRSCQPELKVCNTGIAYRDNKGTDMVIKVVKDMKEVVVSREVCSFNSQGDIRVCVDWDNQTTHRDMKDTKGDWYKVADD